MDERELIERIGGLRKPCEIVPVMTGGKCGLVDGLNCAEVYACNGLGYTTPLRDVVMTTKHHGYCGIDSPNSCLRHLVIPSKQSCHGTGWVPKSRAEAIVALQDWWLEQGGVLTARLPAPKPWYVRNRDLSAHAFGPTFLEAFYAACLAEGYRDPKATGGER